MDTLLGGNLSQYFKLVPVETDEQRDMVFRLRYQIYCDEKGFEDTANHPGQMERDEFDGHAAHSLLVFRETGDIAGTVRLVLANSDCPEALFPIERHCGLAGDSEIFEHPGLSRNLIGEVSRFAISKEFRRRFAEGKYVWGSELSAMSEQQVKGLVERRLMPHMILGLVAALVRMSEENNVTHWYAAMEPALVRLLGRFGMVFDTVGSVMDYHGKRQPCFTDLGQFLSRMKEHSEKHGHNTWNQVTQDKELWRSRVNEPSCNLRYLLGAEEMRKAA